MENYIRKIGKTSLITSFVLLFIGFFMATRPSESIDILIVLFGAVLIIDSVAHFFSYFNIEDEYRFFSYELAQAIICIIFGLLVICYFESVKIFIPIVSGIWIVLNGILKLQIALNIRDVRNVNWGIMLSMSMIAIAIGFAIIIHPVVTSTYIFTICGSVIVITQLMNIYDDYYILSNVKKVTKKKSSTSKSK